MSKLWTMSWLLEMSTRDPATDCWLWSGDKDRLGYGRVYSKGKKYGAHRIAMLIVNGEMPKLCVLHRCDVPGCVNPSHLREGTMAENNADAVAKGRHRTPAIISVPHRVRETISATAAARGVTVAQLLEETFCLNLNTEVVAQTETQEFRN
jgi:hypothetical protein